VTGVVSAVAWLVFIVDYGARLWLARPRARWFWHHLWDLAVVVLPTLVWKKLKKRSRRWPGTTVNRW
jgi:hypothetical protein